MIHVSAASVSDGSKFSGIVTVCPECVCSRSFASLVDAAREQARQEREQREFATQARREAAEISRDPDGCTQWVADKSRYCMRKAVLDGLCRRCDLRPPAPGRLAGTARPARQSGLGGKPSWSWPASSSASASR